jgi:hypothetical protein
MLKLGELLSFSCKVQKFLRFHLSNVFYNGYRKFKLADRFHVNLLSSAVISENQQTQK